MKKKLRFIPLFFILSLIFTALFSISAFALTDGDWEFQLLDDEVTITKYIGTDSNVIIPDKIFGAPVTKVDEYTFETYDDFVTSITFPATAKEIDGCRGIDTLKRVSIPEGVEIIGGHTFIRCRQLESVHLPSTIKEIGDLAFCDCTALTDIKFPAGLQKIGQIAFDGTRLIKADLSEISDATLEDQIFSDCDSLTDVMLSNCFTEIPANMFNGCTALKNVNMPDSLKIIESQAFIDCSSLEEIILPTSLEIIENGAFMGSGLKELVIPYGVKKIEISAFAECKNLKSLYIPDTVVSMHSEILDDSPNAIIYCSADSYCAKFCKENSISYLTDKSVNSLITVYYNGTRISFHEYDQDPALINDRTLVPLRAIFEAMNADVQWDQATQTVTSTRDGVTVKLTIGDDKIYKNGQAITTDVPAQIINDRTMIPVRVIAEAFGADVEWNGSGRAVLINE